MAEDFPAQSKSPQAACLEGVASSDVFVGILGPSYGNLTESGLSATEEEFEEASRLSLARLIFVTTEAVDDAQAAFITRVQGKWGDGLFHGHFESPETLKYSIVKALSALLTRPADRSEVQASAHLTELLTEIKAARQDVAVGLAAIPRSEGAPLVGLGDIDSFADGLPDLVSLVFGIAGDQWRVSAKERSVTITADSDERGRVFLEAFDDGRLRCFVGMERSTRNDLAAIMMIDADRVESQMTTIIEAFSKVLARLDARGSVTGFFLQGILKGSRGKYFGSLPDEPLNRMTVPLHELADPLPFPTTPVLISAQELRESRTLARTLRSTLGRIFGAPAN